ncbi:MAG TPA: VOC family protein, partial [Acidimicrobiales bacterium]|nr:VOC family protein [Acidimicrobiales bacterium]
MTFVLQSNARRRRPSTERKHVRPVSATEVPSVTTDTSVGSVVMKLEIQVIPVSDVDRSKAFYEQLGWRLDDDVAPMDGLRIVQFT